MARLHVVTIANRLPAWAEAARDQYLGHMPRGYEVKLVQLKPREAGKIREKIPKNVRVVALDERGNDLTTKQFAALLVDQIFPHDDIDVAGFVLERDEYDA